MEQESKGAVDFDRATAECRSLRDYIALLDEELHGEKVPPAVKANVDDAFQIITGVLFPDWLKSLDELQEAILKARSTGDQGFMEMVHGHEERVKSLLTFINSAATEAGRLLDDPEAIEHTRVLFVVRGQAVIGSFLDWAHQPRGVDARGKSLDATLF